MKEVAVSVVDFNSVEASSESTLDACCPGSFQLVDVCECHGDWHWVVFGLGDSGRPFDVFGPTVERFGCCCVSTDPWSDGRCFATRMGKLNTNLLILGVGEVNDGFESVGCVNLRIEPDTGVFWGDSAFWEDGGSFDDGETRTMRDYTAIVSSVPRSEMTIGGTVLAHWGDPDAVWSSKTADCERLKEFGCR